MIRNTLLLALSATALAACSYTDLTDTDLSLYRLEPPDGAPQLLAAFPGPHSRYGSLVASPSPDGESVAYCLYSYPAPPDCSLLPAGSTKPLKLAGDFYGLWAPDGSWLLTRPCELVDMAGKSRMLCSDPFVGMSLSPDGRFLATFSSRDIHLIATETGNDLVLPRPGPVDENVFRPRHEIGFTPDSSRLIAIIAHASFSIPTAGGDWTAISSDHGARGMSESDWLDISPDSHIIADVSPSGMVESIDGAPPLVVRSPNGTDVAKPMFEPAGGLDKAIFSSSGRMWLANADGTGDWIPLSAFSTWAYCQWAGRTALCLIGHQDPLSTHSYDVLAVPDDGKQVRTVAHNVVSWALSGRSLFYVPSSGGLHVVDRLPKPMR